MSDINTAALAKQVRSKRGNTSLRELAKEVGDISIATLSRIEQGKDVSTSNFFKICDWLQTSADAFRSSSEISPKLIDHKEIILYHLRADRELNTEVSDALQKMIELAYINPKGK